MKGNTTLGLYSHSRSLRKYYRKYQGTKIEVHKAGKVIRWQGWLLAPWPVHAGLLGPVQSPIEQLRTHYKLLMWLGKAHNLPNQFYLLKTRQLNPFSLKPIAALMFCAWSLGSGTHSATSWGFKLRKGVKFFPSRSTKEGTSLDNEPQDVRSKSTRGPLSTLYCH